MRRTCYACEGQKQWSTVSGANEETKQALQLFRMNKRTTEIELIPMKLLQQSDCNAEIKELAAARD